MSQLDDNPFAVSEVSAAAEHEGPRVEVHEDLLLVKARSARLPLVCILTGETTDLIRHRVRCRFRRLMFVPFGRPCTLTVFVSPSVQKRWRLQRLLLQSPIWIAIALLLLKSFLGIDLPTSWLMAIWLPTLILDRKYPIRTPVIIRYQRPDQYWLRGFSAEQLLRIAAAQQEAFAY